MVYQGDLSNVIGLVHVRKVLNASEREPLSKETLLEIIREPYFGLLATVTGLPAELTQVESETWVRVLEAALVDHPARGRQTAFDRALTTRRWRSCSIRARSSRQRTAPI